MIALSKIKNFVARIRKNKEVEEILIDDELEAIGSNNDIATATETMNKQVNDILVNGNATPFSSVDIDYKENDDINDSLEENVEVETLSFEEAYITDEFPMNEAREMVKERDKKVLSELLYLPETVKKHDANGNRALLAICAIPSVAYMSFVATSVIALPPVAMGVIGFGIAGGLVSGINQITGKNSTLGSLYRKVKARFGHAKPKVDLKEYKYDFDKEKSAKNALLSKHINDFSSKKKTLNDLDKNLDKHFNDIVTTGVSSFSLNDRISQDILDNITNLISEAQP